MEPYKTPTRELNDPLACVREIQEILASSERADPSQHAHVDQLVALMQTDHGFADVFAFMAALLLAYPCCAELWNIAVIATARKARYADEAGNPDCLDPPADDRLTETEYRDQRLLRMSSPSKYKN